MRPTEKIIGKDWLVVMVEAMNLNISVSRNIISVTSHSHAVTRSFATIHCFPQATEATSALFLLAAANRPVTQSQHAIPYVLALCDADLRALPVTKLEVVASVLLLFFGCGRSLALKK